MKVTLKQKTPVALLEQAARTCTATEEKTAGDLEFILKLTRMGHHSILEHAVFTFEIEGVTRACLQEIARHRIASLSVQSSRYCLKKLASELQFYIPRGMPVALADHVRATFKLVEHYAKLGIKNDTLKYALPECCFTKLVWTLNLRSLINMLKLRTSPRALQEFQTLAGLIFNELPSEYQIIVKEGME